MRNMKAAPEIERREIRVLRVSFIEDTKYVADVHDPWIFIRETRYCWLI